MSDSPPAPNAGNAAHEAAAGPAAEDLQRVQALVAAAEQADGFSALNEAASLRLRHEAADTRHLIRTDGDAVIGYGQLAGPLDHVADAALVVAPAHRRRGVGTDLLQEMLAVSDGRLEIWAVQADPGRRGARGPDRAARRSGSCSSCAGR